MREGNGDIYHSVHRGVPVLSSAVRRLMLQSLRLRVSVRVAVHFLKLGQLGYGAELKMSFLLAWANILQITLCWGYLFGTCWSVKVVILHIEGGLIPCYLCL